MSESRQNLAASAAGANQSGDSAESETPSPLPPPTTPSASNQTAGGMGAPPPRLTLEQKVSRAAEWVSTHRRAPVLIGPQDPEQNDAAMAIWQFITAGIGKKSTDAPKLQALVSMYNITAEGLKPQTRQQQQQQPAPQQQRQQNQPEHPRDQTPARERGDLSNLAESANAIVASAIAASLDAAKRYTRPPTPPRVMENPSYTTPGPSTPRYGQSPESRRAASSAPVFMMGENGGNPRFTVSPARERRMQEELAGKFGLQIAREDQEMEEAVSSEDEQVRKTLEKIYGEGVQIGSRGSSASASSSSTIKEAFGRRAELEEELFPAVWFMAIVAANEAQHPHLTLTGVTIYDPVANYVLRVTGSITVGDIVSAFAEIPKEIKIATASFFWKHISETPEDGDRRKRLVDALGVEDLTEQDAFEIRKRLAETFKSRKIRYRLYKRSVFMIPDSQQGDTNEPGAEPIIAPLYFDSLDLVKTAEDEEEEKQGQEKRKKRKIERVGKEPFDVFKTLIVDQRQGLLYDSITPTSIAGPKTPDEKIIVPSLSEFTTRLGDSDQFVETAMLWILEYAPTIAHRNPGRMPWYELIFTAAIFKWLRSADLSKKLPNGLEKVNPTLNAGIPEVFGQPDKVKVGDTPALSFVGNPKLRPELAKLWSRDVKPTPETLDEMVDLLRNPAYGIEETVMKDILSKTLGDDNIFNGVKLFVPTNFMNTARSRLLTFLALGLYTVNSAILSLIPVPMQQRGAGEMTPAPGFYRGALPPLWRLLSIAMTRAFPYKELHDGALVKLFENGFMEFVVERMNLSLVRVTNWNAGEPFFNRYSTFVAWFSAAQDKEIGLVLRSMVLPTPVASMSAEEMHRHLSQPESALLLIEKLLYEKLLAHLFGRVVPAEEK